MKGRVLMIANDFPPIGGAGVQRSLYFAKYLADFGWQPVVLTVKDVVFPAKDPTLLEKLPREVRVFRSGSLELRRVLWLWQKLVRRVRGRGSRRQASGRPASLEAPTREMGRTLKRWFFVPDDRILWAPFALLKSLRIITRLNIQAVFVTAPAYSSGVIGTILSRMTGLPLVLDLRDPWTQDPYLPSPTKVHAWLNSKMEAAAIRRAARVIVISEAMRRGFEEAYPEKLTAKLVVLTNGYDAESIAGVKPVENQNRFVVGYVGSLYVHHLEVFRTFLQAWSRVAERNPGFASESVLSLVGRCDPEIEREARYWKRATTEVHGYLPHMEGLRHLKGADALLLIIRNLDPEKDLVTIPGKLFEYVAAGPPVIMIGPEGDAARIVRETKGLVHHQDDILGIATSLERLYRTWSEGSTTTAANAWPQYERRSLTGLLAAELDSLVADKTNGELR